MSRVALTYRDYEALPADGRRYELHDGALSVTRTPSPQHQIIVRNVFVVLDAHVRARGLGEVLFAPLDVLQAFALGPDGYAQAIHAAVPRSGTRPRLPLAVGP
jgi:hypothetical protein